ncbi:MarR family winged helix-turn-helix transcriptional regulator [Gordonia zhaorongruii]|uniref:MarR family winged helix-turn-helix transcriptional regulator n=1 Tax=Gordonia zhaorongruii TaxID=2597659 RepID=UPI001049F52B|nr:MarR family transcriptional regulator [Gordonia zhaorongruii]
MSRSLSFDLHRLTAQLDRSADRILRADSGLSYRRFRILLIVGRLGPATQRAVAEELGVSEPSASRMTRVLAETGLLAVGPDPSGGNRKKLSLTTEGAEVVERCRTLLDSRFSDLVQRSGVSLDQYAIDTQRLLDTLRMSP